MSSSQGLDTNRVKRRFLRCQGCGRVHLLPLRVSSESSRTPSSSGSSSAPVQRSLV